MYEVANAAVVGDDVVHRRAQLVQIGDGFGQELGGGLRVCETGGKWLGKLVDKRSGEHAHRTDPGRMCGLRMRFLLAPLRGLARKHGGEHFAEERHSRYQQ